MTNIDISDLVHALGFYVVSAFSACVGVGFGYIAADSPVAFAIPAAFFAFTILVAAIGLLALGTINVVIGARKLRTALKGGR